MNPAPSIIGFTTSSGLGYGLLFLLGLGAVAGVIPTDRWLGLIGLLLAFGFITGGLLASTLHLGHPERAWRAISQWRSSWLSREGLLALLTYLPALVLAAGWILLESANGLFAVMAIIAALGAAATVYCTGMIYASLRPIAAWHQPLTAPIYLAFALMTGALALHLLLALFEVDHRWTGFIALAATVLAFILKIIYWRTVATERPSATPETATGLGEFGLVRMLDPPHTQTNYLLHEMGFQIGRKHARRIRMLTYLFGLFTPLIATPLALVATGWPVVLLALVAFVSGVIGVLMERWLFFAEAEHTVMLYYGSGYSAARPVSSPRAASRPTKKSRTPEPPQRRRPRRRGAAIDHTAEVIGDAKSADPAS